MIMQRFAVGEGGRSDGACASHSVFFIKLTHVYPSCKKIDFFANFSSSMLWFLGKTFIVALGRHEFLPLTLVPIVDKARENAHAYQKLKFECRRACLLARIWT